MVGSHEIRRHRLPISIHSLSVVMSADQTTRSTPGKYVETSDASIGNDQPLGSSGTRRIQPVQQNSPALAVVPVRTADVRTSSGRWPLCSVGPQVAIAEILPCVASWPLIDVIPYGHC